MLNKGFKAFFKCEFLVIFLEFIISSVIINNEVDYGTIQNIIR